MNILLLKFITTEEDCGHARSLSAFQASVIIELPVMTGLTLCALLWIAVWQVYIVLIVALNTLNLGLP